MMIDGKNVDEYDLAVLTAVLAISMAGINNYMRRYDEQR